MPDSKYGNMPNNSSSKRAGGSKHSDTDSGAMGSNKGATGGLSKKSDMRADVTATPNTKNHFPKGLA